MRANFFGEKCCDSVDEVCQVLEERSLKVSDVYATNLEPGDEEDSFATAELLENQSGEVACKVECASLDEVRSLLSDLGVEVQE